MKIADLRLTGLAGVTVEGGWANELNPDDNLHTIVEVITDTGLTGVGSTFTSSDLVAAAAKLLKAGAKRRSACNGFGRVACRMSNVTTR